jgi:UPF0755 protein
MTAAAVALHPTGALRGAHRDPSAGGRPLRATVTLCLVALLTSCGGPAAKAPSERIIVPKRASLKAVAESLRAHDIISSPTRFRLTARILGWLHPRFRGLDRHLRPGRYEFVRGERTDKILEDMVSGNTVDDFFTVPEGFTIAEIAGAASRKLGMDSAAFVAAASDPALLARLDVPPKVRSAEGYLFPETYRVVFGASPEQLVQQMVQGFLAVWDTSWDARAAEIGLSRHQVVTLASIVEAEVRHSSDRRMIAGVYMNRLKRRHPMKLEADPTVIYAMGKHVNRVLTKDLEIRSPYNTYLHPGLPPGPIGSPGRASLLAALWPADHDYLFFVARPDGSNMYSRTGAEHLDSVRVARRLRAEVKAARRDSIAAAKRDSAAALAASRDSAAASRSRASQRP